MTDINTPIAEAIHEAAHEQAREIATALIESADNRADAAEAETVAVIEREHQHIAEIRHQTLEENFRLWQQTTEQTLTALNTLIATQSMMLQSQGELLKELVSYFRGELEEGEALAEAETTRLSSTPAHSEAPTNPPQSNPENSGNPEAPTEPAPKRKGPKLI